MISFNELNDHDSAKVLSFSLGYLNALTQMTPKNYEEAVEIELARKLIDKMEEHAEDLKNDSTKQKVAVPRRKSFILERANKS